MRRIYSYLTGLLLWLPGKINAQRVIYSEPFSIRNTISMQVIGKSNQYYWTEKLRVQKSKTRFYTPDTQKIESFECYDARLSKLTEIEPSNIAGTGKQWLVAGETGLDQISVTASSKETYIYDNRYGVNGEPDKRNLLVDSLPFVALPSRLILVRSEDKSKILLLAFENTDTELTKLHILLFDSDWHPIYHRMVARTFFSQPCMQEDEIGFPGESFDNLPIKLADNGEWIMAFPSRSGHQYVLFHVCSDGREFYFREIPLSPYYHMEDIAMSVDNMKQQMNVGILSAYANTTLKNVQVYNYSLTEGRFNFDTAYHFNTRSRDIQNKNLSHERFIAVPTGGYLYMKEYGEPYDFIRPSLPFLNNEETSFLLANYAETRSVVNKEAQGYIRNRGLSPIDEVHHQGDLNLFYFPAISKDSSWSGILYMEQRTSPNNPDLSYLFVPSLNQINILYTRTERNQDPESASIRLDKLGRDSEGDFVFWKMKKSLLFQEARRISSEEVAVPYRQNSQTGFAIIRMH